MTRPRRAIGCCGRGFTLVELLVTVILLMAVMFLLGFPMAAGFAYMRRGVARAEAQAAGRRAMEAMSRELSEAIYVFDIPPEGNMIAFVLPSARERRVSPPGPQLSRLLSEDAFQAAWRLLPAERQAQLGDAEGRAVAVRYWPVLTRFVSGGPWEVSEVIARTEVPLGTEYVYADGKVIPLSVDYRYPDPNYTPDYDLGDRERPQPLPVEPRAMSVEGARLISSLTPNELGYEVPVLRFVPQLVKNDPLQPAHGINGLDYGTYRGRFPMWQHFRTHSVGGDPAASLGEVLIYRRTGPDQEYVLKYLTRVDGATGRVYLIDTAEPQTRIYYLDLYPVRDPATERYAFGVDYDRGMVLFSFPQPSYPLAERVEFRGAAGSNTAQAFLRAVDHDSDGDVDDPAARIVPGSEMLKVGGQVLERVSSHAQPNQGQYAIDYDTGMVTVNGRYAGTVTQATYMWRNNADDDLVIATYESKSLITISLTTAKRTPGTDRLEAFHLTAQVKPGNALR